MSGHRFLFLGGLHRSGTSILHRLLREHPDTSGFSDSGAREDEGQHLQSVFPAANAFGGPGRFAFDPAASLLSEPGLRTAQSRERLLREWGAYYDLGKPVFLEKSPPNLIRSTYFRALFPGSRFVFIVRHPICVALATRKWSKSSILELLLHWAVAHRRMALDIEHAADTILLRYEDLVAAPQALVDRITEQAGLRPFTPQGTVEDRNPPYFNHWVDECRPEAEIAASAAPELAGPMEWCGYSLEPPFVTRIAPGPLTWVEPQSN